MIDITDIKKGINKMIDHGFKPRYLYINQMNYTMIKGKITESTAPEVWIKTIPEGWIETMFELEIIVTELLSDNHFVISQFKLEDEEISDQEQMMEHRI